LYLNGIQLFFFNIPLIHNNYVSVSRSLVSKLRRLEKETHLLQRALADDPLNEEIMIEMDELERQVSVQFRGGNMRIHILSVCSVVCCKDPE
jgi:hypothetical protein